MPSWPSDWITATHTAVSMEPSSESINIIRAWRRSTPLPPLSNNPLGMPAHSSGAPSYLGTKYAIFPSIGAFYDAIAAFAKTSPGKRLIGEITGSGGYPAAWRAISSLNWPGSLTETDYPAEVLDLCAESYRDSVAASVARNRKTSGMVGADPGTKATVIVQAASVHEALSRSRNAAEATRMIIRRAQGNG